jgi:hypothetical protein
VSRRDHDAWATLFAHARWIPRAGIDVWRRPLTPWRDGCRRRATGPLIVNGTTYNGTMPTWKGGPLTERGVAATK